MDRFVRFFLSLLLCSFALLAHAQNQTDFRLKTNAFLDQGILPVLYTCDGKDLSPKFSWKNPPDKTQSFALIMLDQDAPNGPFYHWVLYNLPPNTQELPEAVSSLPAGTIVGLNSWGSPKYNGPCPPKGAAHQYIFTLYALDSTLSLSSDADAKIVLATLQKHILAKTSLNVSYSRWLQ